MVVEDWLLGEEASYYALTDGERIVTWAELEALANRSAAHLTREGIAPGDIVALALPESVEYIALLWSLAWIGAVIFPINAELLRSEDEVGLGARQLKAVIMEESAPATWRCIWKYVSEYL